MRTYDKEKAVKSAEKFINRRMDQIRTEYKLKHKDKAIRQIVMSMTRSHLGCTSRRLIQK